MLVRKYFIFEVVWILNYVFVVLRFMDKYQKIEVGEIGDGWVEVVQGLSDDKKVSEVAKELGYNVRTLEKKVSDIKFCYDIKTIGGLVALFFRNNLIK